MANFSVDGRMTVKTLKQNFKDSFGLTLRVYQGNNAGRGARFAEDSKRIGELADEREGIKGLGAFEVTAGMTVEQFEKEFQAKYDIAVQIADADNEKLAENNMPLVR